MKFDYITATHDEKGKLVVTSDYVAKGILNRNIGSFRSSDDNNWFALSLSDGGFIRVRLKTGGADVIYYPPSSK